MRLEKCGKGHYYDAGEYSVCPFCEKGMALRAIPPRFQSLGEISYLNQGSVSQVFRISGQKDYACKMILCGKNEEKYRLARYEIGIMNRLRGLHQAVQLCDHEIIEGDDGKIVCLLEDFHPSLPDWLSDQTLTVSGVLRIIIGVCDALEAIQRQGVLHLDVQPKNIYIDGGQAVLMGDFSSSLLMEDVSSNTGLRGTLAYIAPEVYREGRCGALSDLYSAGLVLYALLNRRVLPFMDRDGKDLAIYKRLAGTPLPALPFEDEETGCELNRIIRKACAFSPEDRYRDFGAFRADLERLLLAVRKTPGADETVYTPAPSASFDGIEFSFDDDTLDTSAKAPPAPPKGDMPSERPALAPQPPAWDDGDTLFPGMPPEAGPDEETSVIPPSPFSDAELFSAGDAFPFRNVKFAGGEPLHCRKCGAMLYLGANFCAMCGCKTTWDAPEVDLKKVEFSAVAPKTLVKGDYSMIHVIMYEPAFRDVVEDVIRQMDAPARETRSGVHKVREGAEIKVVLSSPDLTIEDDTETGVWQGEHLDFSFAVLLPESYQKKQAFFSAAVYIDDLIATKLKFVVQCASLLEQKIAVTREDVLSAFISYASQDRNRVAAVIQGMRKARPDMDIFFDVDSLRSGEDWGEALQREIERRDVLFLCWSLAARASKWVDAEWRYALARKGPESIEPVPIDPPDICPPPEELNRKHFNDKLLYIINAVTRGAKSD